MWCTAAQFEQEESQSASGMAAGADGSAATEGDSWLSDRDLRDHRLPTGGGGGGAAEAGLSPSDFLPRHAPPSLREAGGLAGLRQWCAPPAQTPLGSYVFTFDKERNG